MRLRGLGSVGWSPDGCVVVARSASTPVRTPTCVKEPPLRSRLVVNLCPSSRKMRGSGAAGSRQAVLATALVELPLEVLECHCVDSHRLVVLSLKLVAGHTMESPTEVLVQRGLFLGAELAQGPGGTDEVDDLVPGGGHSGDDVTERPEAGQSVRACCLERVVGLSLLCPLESFLVLPGETDFFGPADAVYEVAGQNEPGCGACAVDGGVLVGLVGRRTILGAKTFLLQLLALLLELVLLDGAGSTHSCLPLTLCLAPSWSLGRVDLFNLHVHPLRCCFSAEAVFHLGSRPCLSCLLDLCKTSPCSGHPEEMSNSCYLMEE